MDLVHDVLAGGRNIRILTVVDVFSRECIAMVSQISFGAEDVWRILNAAGERRGQIVILSYQSRRDLMRSRLFLARIDGV